MDPITQTAIASYQPTLEGALVLLRAADAARATDPRLSQEKLLAAIATLELLLSAAREKVLAQRAGHAAEALLANIAAAEAERGDGYERHARQLEHQASKARQYAQAAAVELRALASEKDAVSMQLRASIALSRCEQIDELHRNGVCRCAPGTCEFVAPPPARAPLRKAAVLVKPTRAPHLGVVQGEEPQR